jgi:murein DD-endopeptidase MepM/ murein hydrolase activator NlpD
MKHAALAVVTVASTLLVTPPAQQETSQSLSSLSIKVTARGIEPGELVLLTITSKAAVSAVVVRAFGMQIPTFQDGPSSPDGPQTWRALIGIDLEVKAGRYDVTVSVPNASTSTPAAKHTLVVLAKKFPTRTLTVDNAFVDPPASAVPRIQAEADRLKGIWAKPSSERLWSGPFVRPVSEPANSAFGSRSVFNGQARSPHGGADFSSPAGTPVKSPNAGRVALAGDLYFTGNTVVIDHGLGLFSLFAHLRAVGVREGDSVTAGQVVGEVGATGRVTGPHLHWTVRANDARVDPLSLLALRFD